MKDIVWEDQYRIIYIENGKVYDYDKRSERENQCYEGYTIEVEGLIITVDNNGNIIYSS